MGGLVTGVFFIYDQFSFDTFDVFIPILDLGWRISNEFFLYLVLIIAGLVGTSRLITKSHKNEEIYGGYFVGILSQLIAIQIYY